MNVNQISRVRISTYLPEPELGQLKQAKGVMENYMKDKNLNIDIEKSIKMLGGLGNDYLAIYCWRKVSDKVLSKNKHVAKNGDEPFLRRIYKAIEELVHHKDFQAK